MQGEALLGRAQRFGQPRLAPRSQLDGLSLAERKTGGRATSHRRHCERGQRGLALSEHLVCCDATGAAFVISDEHALPPQERHDARAGNLQHLRDVVVGEAGQGVEHQIPALLFGENAVEREAMKVGIQAKITRDALHRRDGSALAVPEATSEQLATVPPEHRVHERAADRTEQLLAADGRTWVSPPRREAVFLVPVKALAKLFRGRFLTLARRALPDTALPEIPWNKSWVVFVKPAVQGAAKVLEYLGRYVHRTALSESALVASDEKGVTFCYRDSRDQQRKTMTLPASEFLRRFLRHAPPKGFHRVRAFGLLHAEHRVTLRQLQLLLAPKVAPEPTCAAPKRAPNCPHCKQPTLRLVRRLSGVECAAHSAAASFVATARAPPGANSSRLQAELS